MTPVRSAEGPCELLLSARSEAALRAVAALQFALPRLEPAHFELGFLPLPLDTARLVAILKGVTVQVPPRPFRVVLVDDDPFLAEVCRDGLEESGIRKIGRAHV